MNIISDGTINFYYGAITKKKSRYNHSYSEERNAIITPGKLS